MEIEKLIEQLKEQAEWAEANEWDVPLTLYDDLLKAAETIKLLWEVAKESYEAKYKMQFDEQEVNNHGG